MCDYSAESAARRDAKVGEVLVTTLLPGGHTHGLMARDDPTTAVCLLPGMAVIFSNIPPSYQAKWGVGSVASAVFDQKYLAPNVRTYRDGVRFAGQSEHRLLQEFPAGIEVSVETIPGVAEFEEPAPVAVPVAPAKRRRSPVPVMALILFGLALLTAANVFA